MIFFHSLSDSYLEKNFLGNHYRRRKKIISSLGVRYNDANTIITSLPVRVCNRHHLFLLCNLRGEVGTRRESVAFKTLPFSLRIQTF